MPALTLPANPYISVFDFRLQFDLTDGTVKIDLGPSVIADASGVGVGISVTAPDQSVFVDAAAFTPSTINQIYSWPLPKSVGTTYMWGLYTVTATCTVNNVGYPVSKKFNLCAPNSKDPYSNDMMGSIQLSVDCDAGTLTARGFCGYGYRGQPPVGEVYNMTRYYPPEAELLPQKNLSVIPFQVDAYIGINKVKGINVSTYDFGDNVFVILRIVAEAEKNVRCGLDMEQIYCGMKSLLERLDACHATTQDYCTAFGEINALVWTVSAGLSASKDVDDLIVRLEKLLGVECRCSACAGEKVGPVCVSDCPQVSNIAVIVDTTLTQTKLKISFNSAGLPQGSMIGIKYRHYCDPGANEPFTAIADTAATGGAQVISIDIPDKQDYQVIVTTVMPDGSVCASVTVVADGICPKVVDINVPPSDPAPVTFKAEWGWQTAAWDDATVKTFFANTQNQRSGNIKDKGDITADFAGAPVDTSYYALRYPKAQPVKGQWFNSSFNYGIIPDQVFTTTQDANYVYVYSRFQMAMDTAVKTIIFKV